MIKLLILVGVIALWHIGAAIALFLPLWIIINTSNLKKVSTSDNSMLLGIALLIIYILITIGSAYWLFT